MAFAQAPATLHGLHAVQALVQPPEAFVVGALVTTRNWATVGKLLDLARTTG